MNRTILVFLAGFAACMGTTFIAYKRMPDQRPAHRQRITASVYRLGLRIRFLSGHEHDRLIEQVILTKDRVSYLRSRKPANAKNADRIAADLKKLESELRRMISEMIIVAETDPIIAADKDYQDLRDAVRMQILGQDANE